MLERQSTKHGLLITPRERMGSIEETTALLQQNSHTPSAFPFRSTRPVQSAPQAWSHTIPAPAATPGPLVPDEFVPDEVPSDDVLLDAAFGGGLKTAAMVVVSVLGLSLGVVAAIFL